MSGAVSNARDVLVVCDNTLGIPGGEVDDGLALLYLLGCPERVRICGVCATHGNAALDHTFEATRRLMGTLAPGIPVVRGADPGGSGSQDAALLIAQAARPDAGLLSLGATTDLALAERLRPGCLQTWGEVALMGGVTQTLVVGERIMDELNFSVDAAATYGVLQTARLGARLRIADAQHCLPLFFDAGEFASCMGDAAGIDSAAAAFVASGCRSWIEHARKAWGVDGFVGWDLLPAVALAEPELVELVPYEVTLDPRMLAVGLLEGPVPGAPRARVELIAPRNPAEVRAHVYAAWRRALEGLAVDV